MSSGYTEKQITEECKKKMNDIAVFYAQPFINYTGKTTDTKRPYVEVVSEFIIKHIDDFRNKIPQITRGSSYKTKGHDGVSDPGSNREEERIAKDIFKQHKTAPLGCIGKIIDYQTPLKNTDSDKAGKIDLLADDGKQLIILELKRPRSKETMLRCVLEGYTYLKTVDKAKLLSSFGKPASYGLSASPLVFKDSEQYCEMQGDFPALRKLMKMLDSKTFYISEANGKYSVTTD